MKRKLLSLTFVFILAFSVFVLSGCSSLNPEKPSDNTQIKIEYYVDGTLYHSQIIDSVNEIILPENPTKSDQTFDGWYIDVGPWKIIFNPANVTENVKVYANFIETSCEHNYISGKCEICGDELPAEELAYNLINDGTAYEVAGIGTYTSTELVIPEIHNGLPVIGIDGYAFEDYTELTSIKVPNSVTSIGHYAFKGCQALEEITLPFVGATMNDGTVSAQFRDLFGWISNYIPESLKKVILTDVSSIGDNTFKECYGLESITIPNSVVSIGNSAFYNCNNLISIEIPLNVRIIGSNAFAGCENLAEVKFSESSILSSIGEAAFLDCTGLTSIIIPNDVTNIGAFAFKGCSELTSISVDTENEVYHSSGNCLIETATGKLITGCKTSTIPTDGSVTSIDSCAFYNCTGLKRITVPSAINSIGYSAFYGCTNLEEIIIPFVGATKDGTTNTHFYYIFGGYYNISTQLKSVVITGSTTIGENAFSNCTGLTNITIPNSVEFIKKDAFYGCTGLTSFTIPDSVKRIEKMAFSHCTNLTSITIPDSVTSIGESVFGGCTGLTEMTIPFVEVTMEDTTISTKFSQLFGSAADYVPQSIKTVVVTGGSSIGDYAFNGCNMLENITIPESVTSIGFCAFGGCRSLKNIDIPSSVTSIGSEAFSGCEKLKSISIPNGVTKINHGLFSGCYMLENVSLPISLTSIDRHAFLACFELKSIEIPGNVTRIGAEAFFNCQKLESITFENKEYWYSTTQINYTEGELIDVSNAAANAIFLKNDHYSYLYKL